MKTNKLFKTVLLLVALVGGVSTSWADGTINIPQDLGTFIPIGTITNTSGTQTKAVATGVTLQKVNNVDGNNETENTTVSSYTIGSTNDGTPTYTFALTVSEAADFLFSFKSGHSQGTAEVSLTLKNSSDVVVWNNGGNNVAIPQTSGSWTPTTLHAFDIGTLAAGTYTMTLTGKSKSSGSYYGNYGNFSFHTPAQYANNWNNTTDINVTDFYFNGASQNGNYINNIDAGDYVEFYTYAPNTACYNLYCGIGYSTPGTDQFTITITDIATSTIEVNEENYTVNSTHLYSLTSKIDGGWKKIRLAFPTQPANSSCRVEHIKFYPFESLPLMEAGGVNTYLDLSKGTFGRTGTAKYNHDPAYESGNQNIGYNGDGGYAEFYVGNTNEAAYYDFHIGTTRYQDDATFTLTITDVATSTVEVSQSGLVVPSGSSYADQTYKLTSPITPGLKLIRIETASSSNSYAFNYNHVTFYKRSLNEAYNYAPVAADGVDVVLTRSIPADKWATICLPFSMDNATLKATYGDDVKIANFTAYNSSTKALTFTQMPDGTDAITANTPCLIKVKTAVSTAKNINGVTIVEGTPEVTFSPAVFRGVYSSTEMAPGDYFVSGGNLYKATAKTKAIKPFRAYFTGVPNAARMAVDDGFGDVTYIDMPHVNGSAADGKCYNLQGQRVEQPTKGLYIVNGKKVFVP